MKLILENLFLFALVASPLILMDKLRSSYPWIERNHGGLSFILWFLVLVLIYFWIAPKMGLEPNPDINFER